MDFIYKAIGTISIPKTTTKVFLGFECCASGKVETTGVAIIKKIYINFIKEVCSVFIKKYRFMVSGATSAGGLVRKVKNKINLKTSRHALEVFLF